MRRNSLSLSFAVAAMVAAFATIAPSTAQEPTGDEGRGQGEEVAFLNITKVVEGDGPTGGYVIEYSCVDDGIDVAPEGPVVGIGGALAFDEAGPDAPETQQVVLTGPGTCTVTETDSNGAATVTYACSFVPGDDGGATSQAFPEGDLLPGCLDDQSGVITRPNDELTITVTNTFEADEEPPPPPPAVVPDVINATPAFTG